MSADAFSGRTLKRKNVKGLALNAPPPRTVAPSESDLQVPGNGQEGRTAQLEIGIEYKLDLKREDLKEIKQLGSGNGGTVSKVQHIATGTVMARKVGVIPLLRLHMLTRLSTDHTRRGQEGNQAPNCARITHHARV